MANRFPLIVDSVNLNIKELPSGDNIDLTGNSIYNNGATLVLPTASGTLATLAGTETLTNKTLTTPNIYIPTFTGIGGDEGGEIRFALAATNNLLTDSVTVDINQSQLRIFETGGTNRGVYLNLANVSAGVGSSLVTDNTTQTLTNKTINLASNTLVATSAQIAAAVTDETGSGSLVFASSPTLVTPNLGTPSAVTLTNATGLPVSTGISGLGTGVATFLATPSSANLAAAITDETGSGSLVFSASPTFSGTANFAAVSTSGNATVGGNLTVTGDLTINGTTTTVNSTTISVDDKNIELGSVATPTNTTADGGGITLKGATDKTLNWVNATAAWTSSEDFNLLTGKVYEINGTTVLSATALGSGVTSSSLTSVGTIGTGTWQGTVIAGQYGGTGVNNSGKTITLGGNLTTSGAFATTLTVTGATNVTLPTTGTLATLAGAETLTNKTLTLPTIGGTGATFNGSTSGTTVLKASAAAGTTTITLPATTGTVVTTGDSGTVTNTMLAGSIANAKLANSTISGVSLGSNLNTLTIGTGLSGTSYNGSSAVTIALANTAVTAGSYGSSSAVPVITVDAQGRITSASTAAISGSLTFTGDVTGSGTTGGSTALTLATVNSNVGSFGSASAIPVVTVNAKGLVTGVTTATVAGGQYYGTAATKAIAYNSNTIAENITISAGTNGLSAGPITISNGYTVTVASGSTWVIV